MDSVSVEFIKILPSILWFVFAVIIFAYLCNPIRNILLPKLCSFEAAGIKLSFIQEFMEAAVDLAEKSPQWEVKITQQDKSRVLNRTQANIKVFQNATILWVDDHPENNNNERRMFNQLGVDIDIACTTEEGIAMNSTGKYDLIISDMARGDNEKAGTEFLTQLREIDKNTPVIFYVGIINLKFGTPRGSTGITNRPDELLQYTLDVLERTKY